jgi:hypothetical protein
MEHVEKKNKTRSIGVKVVYDKNVYLEMTLLKSNV